MLCEIHWEYARDHYLIDKARAIHDEDRMTNRSNFTRFCEKCGLSPYFSQSLGQWKRNEFSAKHLSFNFVKILKKKSLISMPLPVALQVCCIIYDLARISYKILQKSGELLCEIHRECARDDYQIDKARAIHDEDRMTDCL